MLIVNKYIISKVILITIALMAIILIIMVPPTAFSEYEDSTNDGISGTFVLFLLITDIIFHNISILLPVIFSLGVISSIYLLNSSLESVAAMSLSYKRQHLVKPFIIASCMFALVLLITNEIALPSIQKNLLNLRKESIASPSLVGANSTWIKTHYGAISYSSISDDYAIIDLNKVTFSDSGEPIDITLVNQAVYDSKDKKWLLSGVKQYIFLPENQVDIKIFEKKIIKELVSIQYLQRLTIPHKGLNFIHLVYTSFQLAKNNASYDQYLYSALSRVLSLLNVFLFPLLALVLIGFGEVSNRRAQRSSVIRKILVCTGTIISFNIAQNYLVYSLNATLYTKLFLISGLILIQVQLINNWYNAKSDEVR